MEIKQFPSGVVFDSLDVDQDHSILLVSLPSTGKLHIRDVKYLATIAEAMGLVGVSVSVGDFSTFVSTAAYVQWRLGEITQAEFVAKWTI